MSTNGLAAPIRKVLGELPPQEIVRIAVYGQAAGDVIPLWYGESDVVSPPVAVEACKRALDAGEVFYAEKSGIPALVTALAAYQTRLHGRAVAEDRISVTASGMNAINVTFDALLEAGTSLVLVTPLWPNAEGAARLRGAETRTVPLRPDGPDATWRLDLDALFDACDGSTRAIFVNSPNNPTGWMASREEQRAILDFARDRGLWIIADEVYNRIVYDGEAAPSFVDIAEPDDPVIAVNSFSKTWAMTGWRIGWITAPRALRDPLAELIEFATSGVAPFIQRGAVAAVDEGSPFVELFRSHCRTGRDMVAEAFAPLNRVAYTSPTAAFYGFFQVEGEPDSVALARRLVDEARVGLAPGLAFGPVSEGWMRLCFAQSPESLKTALERLVTALR